MADSGGVFKNIRRQTGAEIRKIKEGKGGGAAADGPVSAQLVDAVEKQRARYEHAMGNVHGIVKEIRQVVTAELSLGEKGQSLQLKTKQAGQLLSMQEGCSISTETLPPFVVGGGSIHSHVLAVQQAVLPALDHLLDKEKAVVKDISDYKQQKLEYEHYIHKVQSLEESIAKAKNPSKDQDKLENNKQKLESAVASFEQCATALRSTLQNSTKEVAVDLGAALQALSNGNKTVLQKEMEKLEELTSSSPAWLTAVPASATAIVPAGQASAKQPSFGFGKVFKRGQGVSSDAKPSSLEPPGAEPPARPPPPPPSALGPPPPVSSTETEGMSEAQLRQKVALLEARNQAGAAAYDQVRAEADSLSTKLRETESQLQRAAVELAEARAANSQLGGGANTAANTIMHEEVVELRKRLQQAEQSEQVYRIRINAMEKKMSQTAQESKAQAYPAVSPASDAPPAPPIDTWNPFGSQAAVPPKAAASGGAVNGHAPPPAVQQSAHDEWNPFA